MEGEEWARNEAMKERECNAIFQSVSGLTFLHLNLCCQGANNDSYPITRLSFLALR